MSRIKNSRSQCYWYCKCFIKSYLFILSFTHLTILFSWRDRKNKELKKYLRKNLMFYEYDSIFFIFKNIKNKPNSKWLIYSKNRYIPKKWYNTFQKYKHINQIKYQSLVLWTLKLLIYVVEKKLCTATFSHHVNSNTSASYSASLVLVKVMFNHFIIILSFNNGLRENISPRLYRLKAIEGRLRIISSITEFNS